MSNPLRGSGSEASLRRLVRNRTLTGALVVLAVIVAGVAGYSLGQTGGYASGYSTGYSDGNSDNNKIQESIRSTELNYYGYLQVVLSKLAVDSQNKSANSPNAGFNSLYSVFKAANDSSTVFGQNLTLCAPAAKGDFQATATYTGNSSFASVYQTICLYYLKVANDYTGPLTSFTLQNLSNDFTLLAINLLKLDAVIQTYP
ncbi:MAG TPA: hypothetical protein VEL71_01275 [Candidatus Dormibacteraeota bacterium]|nr:hypothetical protein [Candidatus Dormibacteraeota bacterium]